MAASLYYTDQGSGEPLLFVHGWTCDSNDYLWQIAWFRSAYRVIAPDLRGHGRSPIARDGYDPRTFARDLIALLDALGISRCIVIGHSLGGLIASVLAVEFPERITAVVCLDPAYGVPGAETAKCLGLIDDMRKPDWRRMLAKEFATWEGVSTPAYFRELHVRRMLAMDGEVVKETFRLLFTGDDPLAGRVRSESYLADRLCPVLGIYARDGEERVAWENLHARHHHSRFLHLPLGHWLQQDAPDVINPLIEQWLRATTRVLQEEQPCHHS